MIDQSSPEPVFLMLHELAEAQQAIGNYLGALRRGMGGMGARPRETEVVERAISQLCRARHATHELRALLCEAPKSGEVG